VSVKAGTSSSTPASASGLPRIQKVSPQVSRRNTGTSPRPSSGEIRLSVMPPANTPMATARPVQIEVSSHNGSSTNPFSQANPGPGGRWRSWREIA
jgi:hypothetical protein